MYFETKKIVKIEQIRYKLLRNKTLLHITDYGAGSKLKKNVKTIAEIAKFSVSPVKKSRFFYSIGQTIKPQKILEFGTSFGISTLYFANVSSNPCVITIEADKEITRVAQSIFRNFDLNIKLINSTFDDFINRKTNTIFDLIYLDGNHRKDPTIRYFDFAIKHLSDNGIVILDDIRWSKGMYNAWQEITNNCKSGLFIDYGTIGIYVKQNSPKRLIKKCKILF